jgi:hypothetical protein
MLKMIELKYMKCKECLKKRLKTESGICLLCKPKVHGIEVRSYSNSNTRGIVLKSKSGTIYDNIDLSPMRWANIGTE